MDIVLTQSQRIMQSKEHAKSGRHIEHVLR